jgi:hypothetical protein
MVYSDGMEPMTLLLLLGVPILLKAGGGDGAPTAGERYKPGGKGQQLLFEEAIRWANAEPDHLGRKYSIPLSWATDRDLIWLLNRESGGYVGRPNFQWALWLYPNLSKSEGRKKLKENPQDWPRVWNVFKNNPGKKSSWLLNNVADVPGLVSTAVGLGQATTPVIQANYPNQEQGVGDALEEAVGMLRYIKNVYGSPGRARDCYEPNVCYNAKGDLKTWRGY